MLTQTQRNLLMEAAKTTKIERVEFEEAMAENPSPQAIKPSYNPSKRIDEAIRFLKLQNPEAFFHDTETKTDPAMRLRKFYNEPRMLPRDEYFSYVVPYAPPVIKRG